MRIEQLKASAIIFLKCTSALFVSYVITFVTKELINYGSFSTVFIFISTFSSFFCVLKKQSLLGILFINAVFVAIALLLRFYVVLAYGS